MSEECFLDLRPKTKNPCPSEAKTALFFTTSLHYVFNGSMVFHQFLQKIIPVTDVHQAEGSL